MGVAKRKSLPVDARLLQRARRLLKSASDAEAVRQVLEEAIANREVEHALTKLIREGRGRFVDVYEDRQVSQGPRERDLHR
jgi:hypothetical protein